MTRNRIFSRRAPKHEQRVKFPRFRSVLLIPLLTSLLANPACGNDTDATSKQNRDVAEMSEELRELPVQRFLDLLMVAESGGRLDAKNPRSTALGPFQFIESTFLAVARRHFPDEVQGLSDEAILAKRTDPDFARRAALAYTQENAAYLAAQGIEVTSVNLRLAFLVGPVGAVRLLTAEDETPVSTILSRAALVANPFMANMTVRDLVLKAAFDLSGNGRATGLGELKKPRTIKIPCKITLASCRRWVALRKKKLGLEPETPLPPTPVQKEAATIRY